MFAGGTSSNGIESSVQIIDLSRKAQKFKPLPDIKSNQNSGLVGGIVTDPSGQRIPIICHPRDRTCYYASNQVTSTSNLEYRLFDAAAVNMNYKSIYISGGKNNSGAIDSMDIHSYSGDFTGEYTVDKF